MNELKQIHAVSKWHGTLMYLENLVNIRIMVHWFIWCSIFEPILWSFKKSHLCQISEKVICLSKSLHKREDSRLS